MHTSFIHLHYYYKYTWHVWMSFYMYVQYVLYVQYVPTTSLLSANNDVTKLILNSWSEGESPSPSTTRLIWSTPHTRLHPQRDSSLSQSLRVWCVILFTLGSNFISDLMSDFTSNFISLSFFSSDSASSPRSLCEWSLLKDSLSGSTALPGPPAL